MTDSNPTPAQIEARLQEVARLLRESPSLDEDARRTLAELVDELAAALPAAGLPPDEAARLAGTAAHLADALHHQHGPEKVGQARSLMEEAALAVESRAPATTDLVRRFLDALAGIGI